MCEAACEKEPREEPSFARLAYPHKSRWLRRVLVTNGGATPQHLLDGCYSNVTSNGSE